MFVIGITMMLLKPLLFKDPPIPPPVVYRITMMSPTGQVYFQELVTRPRTRGHLVEYDRVLDKTHRVYVAPESLVLVVTEVATGRKEP